MYIFKRGHTTESWWCRRQSCRQWNQILQSLQSFQKFRRQRQFDIIFERITMYIRFRTTRPVATCTLGRRRPREERMLRISGGMRVFWWSSLIWIVVIFFFPIPRCIIWSTRCFLRSSAWKSWTMCFSGVVWALYRLPCVELFCILLAKYIYTCHYLHPFFFRGSLYGVSSLDPRSQLEAFFGMLT